VTIRITRRKLKRISLNEDLQVSLWWPITVCVLHGSTGLGVHGSTGLGVHGVDQREPPTWLCGGGSRPLKLHINYIIQ
jgi:hypothetical protein